jgi:glucan-binding YG repeat protein
METESTGTEEVSSTESKPNWRRELEAKAKRADELEAQVQQMQRKEVFRDAGLDPSNKMTEYFMKGYEGELSVEAIQAEASSAGLSNTVSQANTSMVEQQAQFAQQVEAERRIAEAGDDAGPVADPQFESLIRQTNNEDELRQLWESNGGTFNAMT